jgi:2-haloacid dehalogenase
MVNPPQAILFDLLTALLDSWTIWNRAAGSETVGRAWRARYLQLTYGSGAYVPYEQLVREAALATGLTARHAEALELHWDELPVWSGVEEVLAGLVGKYKLAIVTNCSVTLGERAARRVKVPWDVVITAEEAGYYKPQPAPYELALSRLGMNARDAVFVAGSGYDLFGTSKVGLRTYWHNRIGLTKPEGAPAANFESSTLTDLPHWLQQPSP